MKAVRTLGSKSGCALIIALARLTLAAQNAPDVQHKVEALEQQSQKYLQEQKPQLAIPVLREIVQLDPNNASAQGNLGVLLFFEGSYSQAIPHLRAALELERNLWKIEALLGIAEKRTGDLTEADLERAFPNLDDKKIQIQAGLELIEIHSASVEFEKALSVAMKLEEAAPQNSQILLISYQLSRQIMDQSLLSIMMIAPDSAEMHMIMANELGRQGDHTNAIAQYREALQLNPALPGAHFELAEQLRTSPDPALNAQAEAEYKAAIRANEYDEMSWRQLGGINRSEGRFQNSRGGLQEGSCSAAEGFGCEDRVGDRFDFHESDEGSDSITRECSGGRSEQRRGTLPSQRALPAGGPDSRC
jgi:tetratricopeptide (TPR) repeat protein